MATEIPESLRRDLDILRLESEFRDNKPISRPREKWSLGITVGCLLAAAAVFFMADFSALGAIFLMLCGYQLIEYQWAKQANKLYDCGSELIRHYRSKSAP